MTYGNNNREDKLLINMDEELPYKECQDERLVIAVLNTPYNELIYEPGNTRLVEYDYNEGMEITSVPCELNPTEVENIRRICYPIFIE